MMCNLYKKIAAPAASQALLLLPLSWLCESTFLMPVAIKLKLTLKTQT